MKLVITGALGHIGSRLIHTAPYLFPMSEVLMIDNLATQRYPSLFHLPTGSNFKFFEEDILKSDLVAHFQNAGAVVHLAAVTDAANSFGNAEAVEKTNFEGTMRVANACSQAGVPLIFVSTTSVYGSQALLVDETCPKSELKPQSPYAASKLHAEEELMTMAKAGKLQVVILRFGTVVGTSPGMRFHTAVNKFTWQATLGQPISVWKTAMHQKRPYLDLHDAISAFRFVIHKRLFDGEIYNVVTENCTVSEILATIRRRVPQLKVDLVENQIMNQLSYEVSRKKIEAKGFVFRGSISEQIIETLDWLSQISVSGQSTVQAANADLSSKLAR